MRPSQKWVRIISGVLLIGICGIGCSSTPRIRRSYYTVSYKPGLIELPGSKRPYPYSVQVNRFNVSRLYNRSQILYRSSPNEIRYYNYKNWAIRPDDMLTDMAIKHLIAANLFAEVSTQFLDRRPDYYLNGEVVALEQYDSGDMWQAHLAISLRLIDSQDGTQIWQYVFDDRMLVLHPEMVYTVNAMSDLLEMHLNRAIRKLDGLCQESPEGRLVKQAETSTDETVPESSQPEEDPNRMLLDKDSYIIIEGKHMPISTDTVEVP